MGELIINLLVAGLLIFFGVAIKYFKAYGLISGYNTASKEEQEYMASQGIGDFMGLQLILMAAAWLFGYFLRWAGYIWGTEIGVALLLILVFYTLIASRRFNPPPEFYKNLGKSPSRSSRTAMIGLVVTVLVTISVGIMIFWMAQPADIALEESQLRIGGAYATTVRYADIKSLELKTEPLRIETRTNGLGLGSIQKGHFMVKDLGNARLFLRSTSGPVIVIKTREQKPLAINYSDPQDTRSLYHQLQAKITP